MFLYILHFFSYLLYGLLRRISRDKLILVLRIGGNPVRQGRRTLQLAIDSGNLRRELSIGLLVKHRQLTCNLCPIFSLFLDGFLPGRSLGILHVSQQIQNTLRQLLGSSTRRSGLLFAACRLTGFLLQGGNNLLQRVNL